MPVQENLTVIQNLTSTLTQTVAQTTTTPAHATGGGGLFTGLGSIFSGLSGAFNPTTIMIVVIAVVVTYIIALRRGQVMTGSIGKLDDALHKGEIVGIIWDLLSNRLSFVPLRRKKGVLISEDPENFHIVIRNPKTEMPVTEEGKPVVFGVSIGGTTSYQVDPVKLTSLGIASIGIKTREWESENPKEDINKVLSKLVSYLGKEVHGFIPLAGEQKLSFSMHIPTVIKNLYSEALRMVDTIMVHLVDVTNLIDSLAVQLKKAEAELTRTKTGSIVTVLVIGAIVFIILYSFLFRR